MRTPEQTSTPVGDPHLDQAIFHRKLAIEHLEKMVAHMQNSHQEGYECIFDIGRGAISIEILEKMEWAIE